MNRRFSRETPRFALGSLGRDISTEKFLREAAINVLGTAPTDKPGCGEEGAVGRNDR